tara:strand:+ start:47879 stop:48046 length:168 start_codon:yes stop_codon:yes gene_type:complete
MNKLTVDIEGASYLVDEEVFDLIHDISLERDELKVESMELRKTLVEFIVKKTDKT